MPKDREHYLKYWQKKSREWRERKLTSDPDFKLREAERLRKYRRKRKRIQQPKEPKEIF